jgi:diguanylate cyclase (GGDEF)-like protein
MIKIYDCSINSYAPKHRADSLGSKENDIMLDLKKYQSKLSVMFVPDYKKADRVITNTTYTPAILKYAAKNNIPLIKRMDGVFWRRDLIERNIKLNEAARQSDAVIFISKFSKDSFAALYPSITLKREYVILNNVNEKIFNKKTTQKNRFFTWGASATNWSRDEKRPNEILRFADFVGSYNEKILLIGKSNIKHPSIINAGYFTDYNKLSKAINSVDAWVNFSYRDAAPKTVLQAIRCGKPVLYADSGGVSELVGNFGIPIPDNRGMTFETDNFKLNLDDIIDSYHKFKEVYRNLSHTNEQKKYIDTLREYVDVFESASCFLCKEHRAIDRLKYLAYHDTLTGLLNRNWFYENADQFSKNYENISCKYVYFIDINNLGEINKREGHISGDAYIKKVIDSIRVYKGSESFIAPEIYAQPEILIRYGGDEFILFSIYENRLASNEFYTVGISTMTGDILKSIHDADKLMTENKYKIKKIPQL